MLRAQQRKLSGELASIERDLDTQVAATTATEDLIKNALEVSENSFDTYMRAPDEIKRLLNQVFFERINVHYEEYANEYWLEPHFTEGFTFLGDPEFSSKLQRIIDNEQLLENLTVDMLTHGGGRLDSPESKETGAESPLFHALSSCKNVVVGLLSCYTEQLRPLLEHAQATPSDGKVADSSEETSKARTRMAITPAEEERFAKEYSAGKSTKQIARESGRSRTAVSAAIKRAGVSIRPSRASTKQEIQEMIALRSSGMSLVKIADRLGYSEKTIWTQLRNAAAN